QRWVHLFQKFGEAGLIAQREPKGGGLASKGNERWAEIAVEVMVEHTEQSRPSRTMVIERTNARVVARFGGGVVALPARSPAFRALQELEKGYPTFRLSTKRNRDIADRPDGAYGK